MIHTHPTRILCFLSFVLLIGCTSTSTTALKPISPHPIAAEALPVIIDTDMAADDWLAILYLLMRSTVDVQAITVTGAGEAHCAPGTRHALDLVALAGCPEIPVACGRETPLKGEHTFPNAWRAQVDHLLGLTLPENVGSSSQIENEVAEWNIYVDPHAAALVFNSGAPVTLVP